MAHEGQDNGKDEQSHERNDLPAMERRNLIAALGAGVAGGLAGCGGDSGGTPTATPTATATPAGSTDTPGEPTDTPGESPTDTPDESTDASGEERTETATDRQGASITRYDHTMNVPGPRGPAPPDAQYQAFNGTQKPSWTSVMNFPLASQGEIITETVPVLLKGWEYRPGVLEATLEEDFYFWDGHNIDADTLMFLYELTDFVSGGEDLDAFPNIVERNKTGEYSFRLALADTWSEPWAVQQTIKNSYPTGSPNYYRSWVEEYRDASSYEEIQDLTEELRQATSTDPDPFYFNPFTITDVTPETYILSLRTRDYLDSNGFDHEIPHYVDELNYTSIRMTPNSTQELEKKLFVEGDHPWLQHERVDDLDLDFEYQTMRINQSVAPAAFHFNAQRPPMSSPRFRRAWAYMLDRPAGSTGYDRQEPNRRVTPFFQASQEDSWVSDDILANLDNYGFDEVMKDKAEQEMIQGGFVRNSDGNWLYKEGNRAGQPMEFTYGIFNFQGTEAFVHKKFDANMAEFGIKTEFRLKPTGALWGGLNRREFEIDLGYWGGKTTIGALQQRFGDGNSVGGGPPSTTGPLIEAPPVGETNNWDDARDYEVAAMTDRLKVLTDENAYQDIVDQLVWVYNQTVPQLGIYSRFGWLTYNTSKYDVLMPDEAPEKWTHQAWRGDWHNGKLSFVPEDER